MPPPPASGALLDVMCRYADLIARTFGRGEGQRRGYCGHEEIELALVKLARFTGETRYMDLARYFIDERGRQPHYFDIEARARGSDPAAWYHRIYEYNQSHVPVREQDKVVGHAVRAMYLYSAMADLAAEDADQGLHDACVRLWHDLTQKRLYVTGGLGPSWTNEGFTRDYDLPNETAYAETCAAVGLVFWAHRMLLMTGEVELRRRHGAGAVQRRRQRHLAGAAIGSSTRTRWPAAAAPNAGSGIAVHAVRPISRGWWHRSGSMSPRSRRTSCRCISTARAG